VSEPRTARIVLGLPAGRIELEVAVPPGEARVEQFLPLARALLEQIVDITVTEVQSEGRRISCRAGCGACCRQLVPIGEAEARAVRDLVEAMPEPRRLEIRARFTAALQRLDAAGLLEQLRARDGWEPGRHRQVGLAYFRQGIPCPFLEDESCSIHPDRPLACREYLVTSPAEFCADPKVDQVEGVKLPTSIWSAVARLDPVPPGQKSIRWVPLVLALEWAEAHPEPSPARPAAQLFEQFFENVTRKPEGGENEDEGPRLAALG
jgi:Fe-S-cluster containining protein